MRNTVRCRVISEETVYSGNYSNNGSSPMWCYSNSCIARIGDEVFASGYERIDNTLPLNDCRWVLYKRTAQGWERQQVENDSRQREPSPLGALPDRRLILSSNPTLLGPDARGGGPAQPQLLWFDASQPMQSPTIELPGWNGKPDFTEHSYRSMAVDAEHKEVILFQNSGYGHAEWALRDSNATWQAGRLDWPAYGKDDLAPFGASHARVNYPVVLLDNRAVHLFGAVAYDNWDRVPTVEDMGIDQETKANGMLGRRRGNRFRRLLYAWTDQIGTTPFSEWLEIDNTLDDGGWVFPGDSWLDPDGTLHILWFRSPMLPTLRDALYPDIRREYSIKYATIQNGSVENRTTLFKGGEGADPAVPIDPDLVGKPYLLANGDEILTDGISTPRFHVTDEKRLFVLYYVDDGDQLSENRIIEIKSTGQPSEPASLQLQFPLTQFFTATPRTGNAPSQTIDLLGYRKGDWQQDDSDPNKWNGTLSYAQIDLENIE